MTLAPLILVVGPSGAGKDALIDGARQKLAATGRFHFARRMVTRPATPGGEDHDSLAPEQFQQLEAAGGFLLSWRAHGLSYAIPRSAARCRSDGVAVVANVSRGVVANARRDLAPVRVVLVTAPISLLAARLGERGRDSAEEIQSRLDRAAAPLASGNPDHTLINDRGLDEAIAALIDALGVLHRR
jgi:phosphonate metabolism protein PhnN/1,5-bisphosphokinase (PRPP-forming)